MIAAKIKSIKSEIENRAAILIKQKFDYDVIVAKVEKAGITTTGGVCENELEDVLAEFKEYTKEKPVWETLSLKFDYSLNSEGKIDKTINDEKVNF